MPLPNAVVFDRNEETTVLGDFWEARRRGSLVIAQMAAILQYV